MKNGLYYEGFSKFIEYTDAKVKLGMPSTANKYYLDSRGNMHMKYYAPVGVALIMGLIIAGITVGIMIAKNKMVKKAHKAEEYLNKESINITNRQDVFLRSHTTHYTVSSSSGGGHHGGGGHSFHHSSSGFSHGGGGRH